MRLRSMLRGLVVDFDAPGRADEAGALCEAWGFERLRLPLWSPGPTARPIATGDEVAAMVAAIDRARRHGLAELALVSIEVQSLPAVQGLMSAAKSYGQTAGVDVRTAWCCHGNLDPRYLERWCWGRPLHCDEVWAMGPRDAAEYGALWGEDRVRVTGYPRLDELRALRSVDRSGARSIAVISSPGWTPAEVAANAQALADACALVEAAGWEPVLRPKNRLDESKVYLAATQAAGGRPPRVWGHRRGTLAELLASPEVAGVIGVETTGLVEAAVAGLPVMRVDYSGRPRLLGRIDPSAAMEAGLTWDAPVPAGDPRWRSAWLWEPVSRAELARDLPGFLGRCERRGGQALLTGWMAAPTVADPLA